MSKAENIRLKIITPNNVAFDQNITFLKINTSEGQKSFLPNHEDFIGSLKDGIINAKSTNGNMDLYIIDGILKFSQGYAFIIANFAELPENIDAVLKQRSDLISQRYYEEQKADDDIERIAFALRQSLMQQSKDR